MMGNEKILFDKLKEKIAVSNFDDEIQSKNHEIIKEEKLHLKKKIFQAIATIAIVATSITAYAGVTGNLNLEKIGLLKLSRNFDESTAVINKSIENDYCKITLEKMAGDGAYLITEYEIEFKEKAQNEGIQIEIKEGNNYNFMIGENVTINSKIVNNGYAFASKIEDNKFKYIEIINVMDENDENLKFEKNIEYIYIREEDIFEDTRIKVNQKIQADFNLKRKNIEKIEKIEQVIDDHNKIIIENIANTKFESFIKIKQIKYDVTWKEYNYSLEYENFLITDNKDQEMAYSVYSGDTYGKKIYVKKNGKYILTDSNNEEMYYEFKDNDIVMIEENYTILLGLDENIKKIKILPVRTRLYNDRTDEEEKAYNQAIWYDLVEGENNYSQKSSLGGTLEINKIEVDSKKVTFYYDIKGKIGNESLVLVRKNNGIMNYMGAEETIRKELTGTENKIIFARENNFGYGCYRK